MAIEQQKPSIEKYAYQKFMDSFKKGQLGTQRLGHKHSTITSSCISLWIKRNSKTCTPKMGKKQRVAFEKCSKFIDEGLEMKFGLTKSWQPSFCFRLRPAASLIENLHL